MDRTEPTGYFRCEHSASSKLLADVQNVDAAHTNAGKAEQRNTVPKLTEKQLTDSAHNDGNFPAAGHHYFVDFNAFQVELDFDSDKKMTYTDINKDGTLGHSETVKINVEPLRENQFLVTWQEADNTTVVHVEDFSANTIVTNITSPDDTFSKYHGTMKKLS